MLNETFNHDMVIFDAQDEQQQCTVEIKYCAYKQDDDYGRSHDQIDILECDIIDCERRSLIGKQVTLACHWETMEEIEQEIDEAVHAHFEGYKDAALYAMAEIEEARRYG